jgi:glycosyltransferase involved in cell wall biosynthesis
MRRLKILVFCHRLDRTGAPIMLFRLVRALRERHDIDLLLTIRPIEDAPLLAEYEALGVRVLDGATSQNYDVVLANTIISGKLISQCVGKAAAVWWVHEPNSGPAFIASNKVDVTAFETATRIVFPTQWQAETLYAPWLVRDNWTTVPYGIGINSTPHPRPAEMPDGCFGMVMLGWLGQRKGQHLAIRAIREWGRHDYHLFLLGSENTKADFAAMLRKHVREVPFLADRVHFLGPRSEDDVNAFLQHCDVLLYPTNDDLISLAILEAMHHGTCVIASDFGPIPETVIHEETGLLFPVDDADALAQQINRIRDDADLKRKLGSAGREIYRRKHGFDDHVAAMEQVLLEAADEGPRTG